MEKDKMVERLLAEWLLFSCAHFQTCVHEDCAWVRGWRKWCDGLSKQESQALLEFVEWDKGYGVH